MLAAAVQRDERVEQRLRQDEKSVRDTTALLPAIDVDL
jgi:hypothetical protein